MKLFKCEVLACDLSEPACGRRHIVAKGGGFKGGAEYTCGPCEIGAANAKKHDVSKTVDRRWTIKLQKQSAEKADRERRGITYPEQVKEAEKIIAGIGE